MKNNNHQQQHIIFDICRLAVMNSSNNSYVELREEPDSFTLHSQGFDPTAIKVRFRF